MMCVSKIQQACAFHTYLLIGLAEPQFPTLQSYWRRSNKIMCMKMSSKLDTTIQV